MYKEKLEKYFEEHMDEILADLAEIVSIESVGDEDSDVKPFGEGSRKALDWGMKKLSEIGMSVRDIDGYAVHGDFSADGEPVLAVLSHLDVVPAGDGWTSDPFTLVQRDGNLYGIGTIDDKGPSVAVIWAAKAIRELGIPLSKNFRIIFGGNEENGCNDIKDYALDSALKGESFQGFKLVYGRSIRKYSDEDKVAEIVKAEGLDPYQHKVLGITDMTKLLGKKKFEELLAGLVIKPEGKPTLVPESDKRPAMAQSDFSEFTQS